MNDLLNNITKPKNIEELYHRILIIVEKLYSENIPNSVKKRKNKGKSKMTDPQIISIQLLIEMHSENTKCGLFVPKSKLSKSCKLCREI